jgi:hypothetical protein
MGRSRRARQVHRRREAPVAECAEFMAALLQTLPDAIAEQVNDIRRSPQIGRMRRELTGSVYPRWVHLWRAGHVEDALDADRGHADNDGHEDVALARTQLRLPAARPLVFKDLELPATTEAPGGL